MELPNGSAVNGTDADDLEADDILVLYATETGSAQDAADRIARHVRRAQYKARVFSMEDYRVVSKLCSMVSVRKSGLNNRHPRKTSSPSLLSSLSYPPRELGPSPG